VDQASGDVTRHETGHEDNFTQCGDFFRNVLNAAEKERLTDNIAGNLSGTHPECNQMHRIQPSI
jgi:catalase